jgi:hypothetical protein
VQICRLGEGRGERVIRRKARDPKAKSVGGLRLGDRRGGDLDGRRRCPDDGWKSGGLASYAENTHTYTSSCRPSQTWGWQDAMVVCRNCGGMRMRCYPAS